MPTSAKLVVPQTYADLRRAVETAMVKGQQEVDLARVRTYHETGRLIHEHVLLFKERADYGAKTIPRLAADVKVDRSVLLRCVQFFRAFPIVATWRQLSWAHFRELLPIADAKQRRALATEANRNAWSVTRLVERIREVAPVEEVEVAAIPAGEAQELLKPNRGTPGVYRVAMVEARPGLSDVERLVVDLGFANYLDLTADQAETFAAGDLVTVDGNGRISAAENATKADLFNYRVEILKVVDGDTLWIKIYLRPRQWIKQKLRLRGLDCPEMSTPEGRAAKRFVDALVAKTTSVIINTTKPDKYDRYLADVFLEGDFSDSAPAISQLRSPISEAAASDGSLFLNNALLVHGQAVRKDAWEFGDWEPELLK